MCQTRNSRRITLGGRTFRVDGCMFEKLLEINEHTTTLGCCCGHGRYPETIVVQAQGRVYEYNTGIVIPRTRRFYRTDEDGYYYIPEVIELMRERGEEE